MHSNMNINMDSDKLVHCKQTNIRANKRTNKDVWAFRMEDSKEILISQNVHDMNHNKGIQNEVAGA